MIEKLKNFPFAILFILYVAYLSYQLYGFHYASDGAVAQHQAQMSAEQSEIETLKKKLTEGNRFVQSLELKKAELQTQLQKLSEYQGTLSDTLDVPSMIKLLVTEAKKIDLRVDKIEPGKKLQKQYYLEQEFKLNVHGSYHQVLLFAQRVSQMQRILRIEAYAIHPEQGSQIVKAKSQLTAQLSVRAYQYTVGKEDRIQVGGK